MNRDASFRNSILNEYAEILSLLKREQIWSCGSVLLLCPICQSVPALEAAAKFVEQDQGLRAIAGKGVADCSAVDFDEGTAQFAGQPTHAGRQRNPEAPLASNSIKITWFGHSAFRLDFADKVVLIDPFFTDNPAFQGSRDQAVEGATHILVTHGHSDHIGDTLEIAQATGAKVVTNFELSMWLASKGLQTFSVAVAVAVRHALTPIVGSPAAPFAFVTVAVMMSAWLTGPGPAVVAAIMGLALVNRNFLEPTATSVT